MDNNGKPNLIDDGEARTAHEAFKTFLRKMNSEYPDRMTFDFVKEWLDYFNEEISEHNPFRRYWMEPAEEWMAEHRKMVERQNRLIAQLYAIKEGGDA